MDKIEHLNSRESGTITHCLFIAAERFDENEVSMREIATAIRGGENVGLFAKGEAGALAADRLADTFKDQAERARELCRRIDDADAVAIVLYDEEV